jgi:tetratricopeptide (TPR) repeat protein
MFAQVVALAPDNVRGYSNLGAMSWLQGKVPEAIAAFEKSLALRPNYRAASNLGTLYFYEQGDYARAAKAFEQALALNDSDYKVWGNLGGARQWAGDEAGAQEAFTRAVELAEAKHQVNPHDAVVLADLADYYASLDQEEKVLPLLEGALALAPDDAGLMYQAALIYEHLGRRTEALTWLARAVGNGHSWQEIERAPALRGLRADLRFKQLRQAR